MIYNYYFFIYYICVIYMPEYTTTIYGHKFNVDPSSLHRGTPPERWGVGNQFEFEKIQDNCVWRFINGEWQQICNVFRGSKARGIRTKRRKVRRNKNKSKRLRKKQRKTKRKYKKRKN